MKESDFGKGAIKQHPLKIKLRRVLRPKFGGAITPYDWTKVLDCEQILGRKLNIKNQNGSESCGGQAKSRWLEIVGKLPEQSAKSIYSKIFIQGGGAYLTDLEKDLGYTSEALVPSYENGNPPSETFMEDVSWNTPLSTSGWHSVTVNIDRDSIANAVRDTGAVIFLIEGSNNGTWLSPRPQPPKKGEITWFHFMCSKGTTANKEIAMYQSWGNVGDNGVQYFGDYIDSGYLHDVFTFVPNNPKPKYTFLYNLQFGNSGQEVANLQRILKYEGYFPYTTFGYFGALTAEALLNWQLAHHVDAQQTLVQLQGHYFGLKSRTIANTIYS